MLLHFQKGFSFCSFQISRNQLVSNVHCALSSGEYTPTVDS